MNTANLGVDRSLETSKLRDTAAFHQKLAAEVLKLVRLRTPLSEQSSYDGNNVNAPYERQMTESHKRMSQIWNEVRQGNFCTSVDQTFNVFVESGMPEDDTKKAEFTRTKWSEYMKSLSQKSVLEWLAEEVVFTGGTILDSEGDILDIVQKIHETRNTYFTAREAVETYEDTVRNRVGEIIKTPIFPTLEARHVEIFLDIFPKNQISFGGSSTVPARAFIAHLDTLSLDIVEKRASERKITDRWLFTEIKARREVLLIEEVQ